MAAKMSKPGQSETGIHREVLKTLVSRAETIKGDMDEARGELGQLVKDAEDTKGINRKAFKLVLSMRKMDDDKRGDFWNSLKDYVRKLDLEPADLFRDSHTGETGKEEDAGAAQAKANTEALKGMKKLEPAVH